MAVEAVVVVVVAAWGAVTVAEWAAEEWECRWGVGMAAADSAVEWAVESVAELVFAAEVCYHQAL